MMACALFARDGLGGLTIDLWALVESPFEAASSRGCVVARSGNARLVCAQYLRRCGSAGVEAEALLRARIHLPHGLAARVLEPRALVVVDDGSVLIDLIL